VSICYQKRLLLKCSHYSDIHKILPIAGSQSKCLRWGQQLSSPISQRLGQRQQGQPHQQVSTQQAQGPQVEQVQGCQGLEDWLAGHGLPS